MLLNLGRHLELVARMRQALWRLFSYPLMLLAAALLVFYFICTVVLPQFAALYGTFELPLPGITAAVLALGAVYPYLFFGALALALVAVLVGVAIRATGRGGTLLEGLLLRVPLIGPVVRASLLARWIDALRIGIDAGLDLPRALALASDATASPRLAREAAALADRIATGGRATDFRGSLIPQTVPAAIDLGAAAGDLPATLGTLSDLYEGQAEHRLRMLPSIITPVMMVLLAVVICTGIAALFAPIIQYLRALGNVM
jgi:type IV pilus assembly protein PilC